ncbi:uncharacterized protein LOC116119647 isoform X1 [Pistacia vera]|uniref:uncharacterized protein LOC116119647 isoform X1 n=1 Tax=Pistacia vera TaxID=55513 RepID=UPI001263AA32|nr:uncharacterized protein LOC116119647 isoform X1 [Pistacia vera]
MDWSDEHVWSVELDIPVGKSIQFKFILKKATGGILWQPGPDRTIQTWETKNTITIMEDWNDAGYQKIIEEEPMASQNGKPAVQSELILPDDVIQPKKELVFGIGDAEYQKIIEEEPMASQNGKPAVQSELILPDEFIQPKKELVVGIGDPSDAVDSDLDWLSTPEKPIEETPVTDESMVMAKDIRRAATVVEKPESSDDEENLISYEGEPVLVHGLTPLETVSTEGDIQNENQSSVPVDASLGMNEAKNHSLPESDEKQEPESDSHQVKEEQESSMTPLESNSLQNDIKQLNDRHSAKQEQEYNVTPLESNVLQNDIQWGRRTLHMLLNGLGLL